MYSNEPGRPARLATRDLDALRHWTIYGAWISADQSQQQRTRPAGISFTKRTTGWTDGPARCIDRGLNARREGRHPSLTSPPVRPAPVVGSKSFVPQQAGNNERTHLNVKTWHDCDPENTSHDRDHEIDHRSQLCAKAKLLVQWLCYCYGAMPSWTTLATITHRDVKFHEIFLAWITLKFFENTAKFFYIVG